MATVDASLSRLRSFAKVFPIGRPRYAALRGRQQWLLGKHDAALRSWRDALAEADRLAMPTRRELPTPSSLRTLILRTEQYVL